MLVYLPGAAVDSPVRLASAVTQLAAHVGRRVPGLPLQVEAFRRAEDALEFLQASGSQVVIVVSDPAFLLDLPSGFEVVPVFRFVRANRDTQRKLVVVRADQTALGSLADLRGRSLAVALGTGPGSAAVLASGVFAGELVPTAWFRRISAEPDDASALANVLFGRTDAAIVSEDHPLLATHLGKELREVYTSPPVSRPVVALRSSLVSEAQRQALEEALDELDRNPENANVLAGLNIDGLRRIPEGPGPLQREGLLRRPAPKVRTPEIAIPGPLRSALDPLPGLKPDQLPFVLGVELVDPPLPSTWARESAGDGPRP
jgi:hypothetical protein